MKKFYNDTDRKALETQVIGGLLQKHSNIFDEHIKLSQDVQLFKFEPERTFGQWILEYYFDSQKLPDNIELMRWILTHKRESEKPAQWQQYLSNTIVDYSTDYRALSQLREWATYDKFIERTKNIEVDSALDYVHEVNSIATDVLTSAPDATKTTPQILDSTQQMIMNARSGEFNNHVRSGISFIDTHLGGFVRSEIHVIAGRAGMGKTSLLIQLANNFIDIGYGVGVFSLEMTSEQLMIRLLSHRARLDSNRLQRGHVSDTELKLINEESDQLKQKNLFISDATNQNIEKLLSRAALWITKTGIDVLMIDYLGLIKMEQKKFQRYDQLLGEVTWKLKMFAKSKNIAVVLFSQLNRQAESRNDKRPALADLRDSGSIEQDSATVSLIFRPDVYGLDYRQGNNSVFDADGKQVAPEQYLELIIAKNRFGQRGTIKMMYQPEYSSFKPAYSKAPEPVYQYQGNYETEPEPVF